MERELILRVSVKDCDVQTFRAGGKGGQNQNKRDMGVRIVHRASGAVGEARDERSQRQNKKLAWRRMAQSQRFRTWLHEQCAEVDVPPAAANQRRRTYNMIDRYVKDHQTGDRTSEVERVLDGDIDLVYADKT